MRFLCRWHIRWTGVPNSRSIAMTIAIAIVGGLLLETGGAARTTIESSASSASTAAETGPGGVIVAPIGPGSVPSVAFPGRVASASGSQDGDPALALGAAAPLASITAPSLAELSASLRTLDPDVPDQLPGLARAVSLAWAAATASQTAGPVAVAMGARQARKPHHRRRPGPWRVSPRVTWYGPGFYGNRTACGQRYTRSIVGVAHRTLPCGTLVQFRWHGKLAKAPVIDRGPYGPRGYVFDWSARLACKVFKPRHMRNGCFTRVHVAYRVVGKVDLRHWFKHRRRRH